MAIELRKKIKKWILNKAEQCREVMPLYSFARDRKLTLLEKLRVRFHCLTCQACTAYIANLNFMHEVFQTQEEKNQTEKLHITLSDEARERMKKALKDRQ